MSNKSGSLFSCGVVLMVLLLGCMTSISRGEEGSIPGCEEGGPCIIVPGSSNSIIDAQRINVPKPVIVAAPAIDLEQEPWWVESASLPINHPALSREKMLWADSLLWVPISEIMEEIPVEKWITPLPDDLAGKYILIEVWATWCPPCRRTLPYLNFIQEKYKDDLVVIAICETSEEELREMPGPYNESKTRYSMGIDTGRRLANRLGVFGIPHVILLEPMLGGIVWEGMPTLPGHELSDKILDRCFAIGRKLRESGQLPEVSPIKFVTKEATDEERAKRRRPKSAKEAEGENGGPTIAEPGGCGR